MHVELGGPENGSGVRSALEGSGASLIQPPQTTATGTIDLLIIDALQGLNGQTIEQLYRQCQPLMRGLNQCASVVVLSTAPQRHEPVNCACHSGLRGFTRSLAKELGRFGTRVNLISVPDGAHHHIAAALNFFATEHTCYVTGQVITLNPSTAPSTSWQAEPLRGKVAVVTGAAGGIGRATVLRLAQEGAKVICVDVPGAKQALEEAASACQGIPLAIDITSPEAPKLLLQCLSRIGEPGIDVFVHNAGITRDKSFANMDQNQWQQVMDVNLNAIIGMDKALLAQGALKQGARLVYLSSISGIAGNYGQTNYGYTKAALIGYVDGLAETLAEQGISACAVAPGFIETPMTRKMPFVTREVGRRLNAFKQGGIPMDVAQVIACLATEAGPAMSGNTIRVCGQQLLGA